MKYADFEQVVSNSRMHRYLSACGDNTRSAMTLYRKNLQLSQELFTVISCFELALRNKIDSHYITTIGDNWLLNSITGIFSSEKYIRTTDRIRHSVNSLGENFNHNKLVAEMNFGFWRFLFATPQFSAAGATLLKIFPRKPKSSAAFQYNHSMIFTQLAKINDLRNRIAHHEPICFVSKKTIIDTGYARRHYQLILELFQWMNIDERSLLYGMDHVMSICDDIDNLNPKSTFPSSLQ